MKQVIQSLDPVVLVGGGQATPKDLQKALTLGRTCVAADGGAQLVCASGRVPDAVIGDFDSIPKSVESQIPRDRLFRVAEQDSTDFEKALGRITAPVVIGVGFTGGRTDHHLAVCHGLFRFADRPCVLLAEGEIILLAPPQIALPTRAGDVVSLFPLTPVAGASSGLRWDIDGLDFAPGRQIGTSNMATGPCTLRMNAPGMLLILPRALIQPVVAALMRQGAARWPAL